jgi:penicillin-binding protein 1A
MEPDAPEGLVRLGNEWYYEEYTKGAGVNSVSGAGSTSKADDSGKTSPATNDAPGPAQAPISQEEKKSIFDLFRN